MSKAQHDHTLTKWMYNQGKSLEQKKMKKRKRTVIHEQKILKIKLSWFCTSIKILIMKGAKGLGFNFN